MGAGALLASPLFREVEAAIASEDSPDTRATGSRWRCYLDGTLVSAKSLHSAPIERSGNGSALGAGLATGDARSGTANAYPGELEEVRLWRTPRTHERIVDNLFIRLKGERSDLFAYYTFDADPTGTERVADASLRDNDLSVGTGVSLTVSTAPIGVDGAEVRSAISLVTARFQGTARSAPAASISRVSAATTSSAGSAAPDEAASVSAATRTRAGERGGPTAGPPIVSRRCLGATSSISPGCATAGPTTVPFVAPSQSSTSGTNGAPSVVIVAGRVTMLPAHSVADGDFRERFFALRPR